jgi:hypothetical protein
MMRREMRGVEEVQGETRGRDKGDEGQAMVRWAGGRDREGERKEGRKGGREEGKERGRERG